nr:hypothetical protein [Prochloraceae cyanobacterium]
LKQRSLDATKGEMVQIGSLALSMYESLYGYRPRSQFEQVGDFKFKTYHYQLKDVEIVDRAIDTVLNNPPLDLFAL